MYDDILRRAKDAIRRGDVPPEDLMYRVRGWLDASELAAATAKRPRRVKGWFNVYERIGPELLAGVYKTRFLADHYRTPDCIACIEREITYTVGEGLIPPHAAADAGV